MATKATAPVKAPRRKARETLPGTPDPVEIAMAAAASGKPLPDVARRVLEEQAELIRAQRSELRVRHVGETVRAALWGILAVAALAIMGMLVALVLRAARSDALVVESFRVPPAIAERGLTGEVVATQVLDKLAEMQAASESTRAGTSYANNWGEELKIDIPQTGASADQLWNLLRGWLGKETRISGEVIETGQGLALTTRVGGTPGQRFVNPSGDLDALVLQGAELIYRETQPYRYGIYANRVTGRRDESIKLLKQLTGHESERERKWAYNGLSVDYRISGDFYESLAMAGRALAIDPEMIPAAGNRAIIYKMLGRDQTYIDLIEKQLKLSATDEYDARIVKANECLTEGDIGFITRSLTRLQVSAECFDQVGGAFASSVPYTAASIALLRHDAAAAAATVFPDRLDYTAQESALDNATLRLRTALQGDDRTALAGALSRYDAALDAALAPGLASAALRRAQLPAYSWPLQAEALARLGKTSEAGATIARTPLDCYTCVRVRGLVAQSAGNAAQANKWYAAAVRLGPRLAPAYADWGRLLLERRQFAAAQQKLAVAARLAPTWADPLKYSGDAFRLQDNRAEALERYDAALKLAPKWEQLQRARRSALARR